MQYDILSWILDQKKKKRKLVRKKKNLLKYKVVVELITVYQFLILTIASSVCEIFLEEPDWMIHMKLSLLFFSFSVHLKLLQRKILL